MNEGARYWLQQAGLHWRAGRIADAIAAYQRLLTLCPEDGESWYNLGVLQRQDRRFSDALTSYRTALERGASAPEEIHLNRAVILSDHLGRSDEAKAELETALALKPDYVPALLNLGNLHEDFGQRKEAEAAYRRARAADPANALALARLAGVVEIARPDDPLIAALEAELARPALDPADRADLGFALGRARDAAGAYDQAFAAYADANRASRDGFGADAPGYDRAGSEARMDALIRHFPANSDRPAASAATPLFICGMFRSGSTLAEQILASHPLVTPGGELDLLPNLVRSELPEYPAGVGAAEAARVRDLYLAGLAEAGLSGRRITDKRPDNFLHIGLIETAFPGARIIHTVRNPLDNILSIYFLHLGPDMPYAFRLEDIAHHYVQYRRLMEHWRAAYPGLIFDLDYDALVADPAPVIAALLDFCDLPWDDACLAFDRATNPVKTASAWQVREPLYRRSSGRRHHYSAALEPARRILADAGL